MGKNIPGTGEDDARQLFNRNINNNNWDGGDNDDSTSAKGAGTAEGAAGEAQYITAESPFWTSWSWSNIDCD